MCATCPPGSANSSSGSPRAIHFCAPWHREEVSPGKTIGGRSAQSGKDGCDGTVEVRESRCPRRHAEKRGQGALRHGEDLRDLRAAQMLVDDDHPFDAHVETARMHVARVRK